MDIVEGLRASTKRVGANIQFLWTIQGNVMDGKKL